MRFVQFFAGAIGDDMNRYLLTMKFSVFFLFSCGSVVTVKSAQQGLKTIVKE